MKVQSPSEAEKSNTSAKGLLGIATKLMILLAIPSKPFALVFDFSALYTLFQAILVSNSNISLQLFKIQLFFFGGGQQLPTSPASYAPV
jgi:hypothetical protein